MTCDPIQLGIFGLGRGFALTAPAILNSPFVHPAAAVAPRLESRQAFERDFGGKSYETIEQLLRNNDVEAIYVATPHQLHKEHVIASAESGKHILVDKPIAIDLADAEAMVETCRANQVHLIVGPSHSFDGPVALALKIIQSGEFGAVKMVHAFNCTDFLYRPRRAEELQTEKGGGVLFSQAIHQIDIIRILCGGKTQSVFAKTGNWDPNRPTEGAYTAILDFENGCFASLTYSGYGRFSSDIWQNDIDELGRPKSTTQYGEARNKLSQTTTQLEEEALKQERTYKHITDLPIAACHEHFGPIVVFCEHADIRLTHDGVEVYADDIRKTIPAPFSGARAEVFDALYTAIRDNKPPIQSGRWGLASLEVCHAVLKSAQEGTPISLSHQVGINHEQT